MVTDSHIPPTRMSFRIITCAVFIAGIFQSISPVAAGQTQPKPRVVATLFPLQEFARAVGGENVQVDLLLPPGTEAHTWEPKPSDVAKIARADIFIYIGPSMEPWADKILQAVKKEKLKVIDASSGLQLLAAKHTEEKAGTPAHLHEGAERVALDPHVWLDFMMDCKIVDSLMSALGEQDPARASSYRANAEAYKARLNALDQRYRQGLSRCRHHQIILSGHAAFAYLAQRYGLKQMALSGISPDAEPTPKRMIEVIEATRKKGIQFVFAEEMVNPKLAQALAKEAGVGILILNPGHNVTREQIQQKVTFLDLMETNLKNLERGLECPQ
jgi:zinc transport system substrate-binding protein